MTVKAREKEIVCKVRTQQAENFDEEVKSLVSAWFCLQSSSLIFLCFWATIEDRTTTSRDKDTMRWCQDPLILSRLSFAFNARLRYLFHSFSSFFLSHHRPLLCFLVVDGEKKNERKLTEDRCNDTIGLPFQVVDLFFNLVLPLSKRNPDGRTRKEEI